MQTKNLAAVVHSILSGRVILEALINASGLGKIAAVIVIVAMVSLAVTRAGDAGPRRTGTPPKVLVLPHLSLSTS